MRMRTVTLSALALCLVLGFGAIGWRYLPSVPPANRCVPPATAMSRLELIFGMSKANGSEVGEADWHAFLDSEVTPRFPDGLTVLTGYGQWRNKAGSLVKETSRMLVIWTKSVADNSTAIEAIRSAWKARFRQDSVMRVEGLSCVSF